MNYEQTEDIKQTLEDINERLTELSIYDEIVSIDNSLKGIRKELHNLNINHEGLCNIIRQK